MIVAGEIKIAKYCIVGSPEIDGRYCATCGNPVNKIENCYGLETCF